MKANLIHSTTVNGRLCLVLLTLLAVFLGPVASGAQVLINGTANGTTLFGAQPLRAMSFVANQTTDGALSVPTALPQYHSTFMTTTFQTGVVLTFMNQIVLSGVGPGMLAKGFSPGGQAQPVTFAPATIHPGTTLPVSTGNMRVGFKSAAGSHFGGALALAGFDVNQGLFQTNPTSLIRQLATRPLIVGGQPGTAPTISSAYVPNTTLLDLSQNTISAPLAGSEARYAFPWTTGSISGVALIGPPVPYGGAGQWGQGTSMEPTSPINFRTVAGFDGRAFNATAGTLTGNLQLVSPVIQNARYSLTGQDSIVTYWELNLTVVPEPNAVIALSLGLLVVLALGVRRARS